jgi:hypothetical protein
VDKAARTLAVGRQPLLFPYVASVGANATLSASQSHFPTLNSPHAILKMTKNPGPATPINNKHRNRRILLQQ